MSMAIKSGEYLTIPKTRKLTEEQKKEAKKKIAAMRERDEEMVTGTFKNMEAPGADMAFWYRKYDEPPRYFHFYDGHQYTIPRMVADHINIHTRETVYEYQPNPFGAGEVPVISNNGKQREKYLFVSSVL